MLFKSIVLSIISLCALPLLAAAPSDTPDPVPSKSTVNPKLPTLWIIGDSTVKNGTKGEVGWGDPIKALFDRNRINVENRALGGRSSRSYRTEGLWKKVLDDAKPGDFVLMQFGHNDGGPLPDEKGRASLRGMGDETKPAKTKDGADETVHTFGWYMEQYIGDAKAKGMTPIVCSYIPRCPRPDAKGGAATMPTLPVEPTTFALWAKQAAENQHVEFINLNGIIWDHYAGMNPDQLKETYFNPADWTHTNAAGAQLNAECVVQGLRALPDDKLKEYLLPAGAK